MSDQPRQEALVAAVVLGIVKAHGWMEMPIVVDVNRAIADLRAGGGVAMERAHAIEFTRGLIDKVCEVEGWPVSEFSEAEERSMAAMFGDAYDELLVATASEEVST